MCIRTNLENEHMAKVGTDCVCVHGQTELSFVTSDTIPNNGPAMCVPSETLSTTISTKP
jgi:hypothetical protein